VDLLRASMPEGVPRVATIAVDLRVLVAAAATALLTGLLFGLGPALQVSNPDLSKGLRDGGRSGTTARQPLRSALVAAEVALAVVLLVGAALFIGSFVSLMRIDPGFSPENILTAQISPRVEPVAKPRDRSAALADIVDRVGRIPGVVHASILSGYLPFSDVISTTSFPFAGRSQGATLTMKRVTAGYHLALRIRLLRGRLFSAADRRGSPEVAILNETAAKEFFPGEDPIGRVFNGAAIVGVVADVHQNSLERETLPEMYTPLTQGRTVGGELVVRTTGDPYEVLPAVRAAVYAVLPDVPLRNITTMEQRLAKGIAQRRLNMLLLGLFGLLGLVIATVGIYGLMAFVVAQRTREIGVRMALGASRSSVVTMVMRRAFELVLSGLVAGSIASWYLSAAAQAFLFRLEPTDFRAYAAAAVSILVAALAATALPARRAASVDPVEALRAE
jgi:putative ABC transport system permease protein